MTRSFGETFNLVRAPSAPTEGTVGAILGSTGARSNCLRNTGIMRLLKHYTGSSQHLKLLVYRNHPLFAQRRQHFINEFDRPVFVVSAGELPIVRECDYRPSFMGLHDSALCPLSLAV
ncbi:unnamed protein product [Heligmosomoides polygyrus]|uniref:POR_N domain-containing protein n=1 Tax=Heligmosomoides polygyrus TaxID=6339 RepID=A0A3P7ZKK1_HELPZ|nr:unnamed protein product [Heligmosomoides polygyrus]